MQTRPRVIVLLAIIMFLAPFCNLYISAKYAHVSVFNFMKYEIYLMGFWPFFFKEFFGHLTMAAALFAMKSWSLPLAVISTTWFLYNTSSIFDTYATSYAKAIIMLSHMTNLSILVYFLLPKQRTLFLNRRLRWWESKPRYTINTGASIQFTNTKTKHKAKIHDISINGCYINGTKLDNCKVSDTLNLEFKYQNIDYFFHGIVVTRNLATDSLGVKFQNIDSIMIKPLKNLLWTLENDLSIERRPERVKHQFIKINPKQIIEDKVFKLSFKSKQTKSKSKKKKAA